MAGELYPSVAECVGCGVGDVFLRVHPSSKNGWQKGGTYGTDSVIELNIIICFSLMHRLFSCSFLP